MIAISKPSCQSAHAQRDELFLELLPAIEQFARLAFRHLQPQAREEAMCAVVADAFCAFRRMVEQGKQDRVYATPLARFAVARYRSGRRVGSRLNTRDVLASAAQRQRGFSLVSLPTGFPASEIWQEALADDTLTPIPDQVAFRLDFPAWLRGLNRRDRKLTKFLALGNKVNEAARRFGISQARVSQLRKELRAGWRVFQGEAAQPAARGQGSQHGRVALVS